jgi:hypothetical protein
VRNAVPTAPRAATTACRSQELSRRSEPRWSAPNGQRRAASPVFGGRSRGKTCSSRARTLRRRRASPDRAACARVRAEPARPARFGPRTGDRGCPRAAPGHKRDAAAAPGPAQRGASRSAHPAHRPLRREERRSRFQVYMLRFLQFGRTTDRSTESARAPAPPLDNPTAEWEGSSRKRQLCGGPSSAL